MLPPAGMVSCITRVALISARVAGGKHLGGFKESAAYDGIGMVI